MKHIGWLITAGVLIIALVLGIVIWSLNKNDEEDSYNIMYFDGIMTQKMSVKNGDLYSIGEKPYKRGYDFIGYFDSEYGGTQYTTADGVCLVPFNESKNILLYPHFVEKTYQFFLDYGESVGDVSFVELKYSELFDTLPMDLTIENKSYMIFSGWYTEANCEGKLICDQFSKNVLSVERAFEDQKKISNIVYAGFKPAKVSVNFYDNDKSTLLNTVETDCGLKVSDIIPQLNLPDGRLILEWSKFNSSIDASDIVIKENLNLYPIKEVRAVYFDSKISEDVTTMIFENDLEIKKLPEISRIGYILKGWYLNSQKLCVGDSVIPGATYEALWVNKKQIYSNYVTIEVDDDPEENLKDMIKLSEMYEISIEELKKLGFTKVKWSISVTLYEEDDGYQEIYISRSINYADAVFSKTDIDHGGGWGATTSKKTYRFDFECDLSACRDTMYVLYDAHGDGDDDWKRDSIVVTITIS